MKDRPVEAILDIRRWGNSLGVRIPTKVARAANLRLDQRVRVTVEEEGRVVIVAEEPGTRTLEQRLAAYDVSVHGGEVLADRPLGAEKL
jgi:antitoxin MazE